MNLPTASLSEENRIDSLLKTAIAPQATQLDRDPQALKAAFRLLGEHQLLGLRAPREWGGQDWEATAVYQFIEQSTRYSGALAFLQIQHQRAVQEVAASNNQALKQAYLKQATSGQLGLGVGYSHLRRVKQPISVTQTDGGYIFNGTVPWITGFGIFDYWLLAAELPDGQAVFVLVPFVPSEQGNPGDDGVMIFDPPLALAAMGSTQTVTATLQDYFVSETQLVDIKPPGWIHAYDRAHPFTYCFFTLGCAQAGLDILAQARRSDIPAIADTYAALNQEVQQCRDQIYQMLANPVFADCLRLRAWSIDQATRCAHAAVAASRGAANYSDHPAQRVYRESLVFTVFGQNNDVMNATLESMTARSRQVIASLGVKR
ncbi:acyl-CoA/acyl-ACP dehydrogenase [filamentous cyanobacterium LEGE 11480]|uniref:Acyl-CoA/acyl-ACP dehydrogenase n=1 Tax=Romeriopsis navalis LEGE 11480 TaxID=2777977 RepID=A0A928Z680_9CYAN|nr:acyl-CoA dehydrogenase family protein [Romeriopsis navalis]MBE9031985.1 acyl-CoA/acyl-ACP dehydrogenase [Romeriopsis navalis LEGE 11480]